MYRPIKIANYFLTLGQGEGIEITPMKLIKLTYIAHGWYLGFKGEQLLNEAVYAWKYGPVIHSLYDFFKEYGSKPITHIVSDPDTGNRDATHQNDVEIASFLKSVWNVYKKYDGIALSAMTHQKGTPWDRVWNGEHGRNGRDIPIPNNYIKEHYQQKIAEAEQRASLVG